MLIYVYLLPENNSSKVESTDELVGSGRTVNIDYDAEGNVIGIEFTDAKRMTVEEV